MGEVMLPAGIGESEIDFFGYGGVEGGGYALETGKFGVIRRGVGAVEGGGGDEFGGAQSGAAGGGGDAALGGRGKTDGGGLRSGHESQVYHT